MAWNQRDHEYVPGESPSKQFFYSTPQSVKDHIPDKIFGRYVWRTGRPGSSDIRRYSKYVSTIFTAFGLAAYF
jgi:hypothetical protein